jgi:hypothetical protein
MPGSVLPRQLLAALLVMALCLPFAGHGQAADGNGRVVIASAPELLNYTIEWRLVTAGVAKLKVTPGGTPEYPIFHSELQLESTGLVSKLYKVNDRFFGNYDPGFCAVSSQLSAEEGRRRRDTRVTYDRSHNKAVYLERDLVKNSIVKSSEIDIPHCVHDVVSALLQLRALQVDPGKTVELPMSDGKKFANVRVEAQEREQLKINDLPQKTIRYEAFLFNNVLYSKKARLFVWLTDDQRRLPVQIRLRMNFPIGTVTLTLDKLEKS